MSEVNIPNWLGICEKRANEIEEMINTATDFGQAKDCIDELKESEREYAIWVLSHVVTEVQIVNRIIYGE